MAKFCRACGAALQEGDKVCSNCGTNLEVRQQPAAQPKKEDSIDWKALWNNVCNKAGEICGKIIAATKVLCAKVATAVKNADWQAIAGGYRQYIRIAVIVMVLLSLVMFVLHTFSTYDVTMTASYEGETLSQSGPLKELYEADEFAGVQVVNILYGIGCLAMAVVGAVVFMKKSGMDALLSKVPVVSTWDGDKLYQRYCLAGAVVTVLYLILNGICGSGDMYGVKYSISAHFTNWIALVLYVLLTACNFLLKATAVQQLPEETSAE